MIKDVFNEAVSILIDPRSKEKVKQVLGIHLGSERINSDGQYQKKTPGHASTQATS